MISLLKKEIISFLGSLTGYLVVSVFLLATGLFLWIFPGAYNIPDSGYASLESLFDLAPWVYLFLIPAITMRLFAEEKRTGTMELLITRPISAFRIVCAKFIAAFILVIISLLPTLIYYCSVYLLGNPAGNLDTGGTWGSFIGLLMLASVYISIGIFASALTDNQVFSFILAIAMTFLAYMGFNFVGAMNFPAVLQEFFINLGINEHYLSLSRGVIDFRDVLFFLVFVLVFLYLSSIVIVPASKGLWNTAKMWGVVIAVIVLFAAIPRVNLFRIDLTAEKRYSLMPISKEIVKSIDSPVHITLYLDGELPAGFRKLQKSILEKLNDYKAFTGSWVQVEIKDPYQITDSEKRNNLFEELVSKGLQPTDIRQKKEQGVVTQLVFPGVVIEYRDKSLGVNLLKNNPSLSADVNLNNSVETLEYEFSRAFSNLLSSERESIAFLVGNGELNEYETRDITETLSESYMVDRIDIQELNEKGQNYKAIIIADPVNPFTEKDKFVIDQYLMEGGRVMWLIDPVQVCLDSLETGYSTFAMEHSLNLNDMLFRYGIRLNMDLLQDVECLMIPVNTAPAGTPAKFTPAPWYYSPLLTPSDDHVISRNQNRIKAEFVSSIDTIGKMENVSRTVILSTSLYSRTVETPVEVSLSSINTLPDRSLFSQSKIPVGILLEGSFTSVFKNRILKSLGIDQSKIISQSNPTKMIVFSDGNLIANKYRMVGGKLEYLPLGYDRYSKQTFGNKDILVNAINYLCDDSGLMELQSRSFKLRLLDKVKLREERLIWQLINLIVPLLLILVFGLVFNGLRKRKYSR